MSVYQEVKWRTQWCIKYIYGISESDDYTTPISHTYSANCIVLSLWMNHTCPPGATSVLNFTSIGLWYITECGYVVRLISCTLNDQNAISHSVKFMRVEVSTSFINKKRKKKKKCAVTLHQSCVVTYSTKLRCACQTNDRYSVNAPVKYAWHGQRRLATVNQIARQRRNQSFFIDSSARSFVQTQSGWAQK